jgi:integrase
MRTYGTGSLWLRTPKRHPDGEFWLRYRDAAGRQRTENSHFCFCCGDKRRGCGPRAKARAELLLARRIGEAQLGTLPSPKAAKTLVSDLAEALFKDQRAALLRKIPENLPAPTHEWRSKQAERILKEQRARWDKHLAPKFGDQKAALVTAADLTEYQATRIDAKARHATVNRELQLLRRAFRLGYEVRPKLVSDIPKFPARLAESPRVGFIEDKAFEKLLAAIKERGLRGLVLTAFRLGFRKSELQNLLCLQLADGWLRLFAGATKNGKARAVKLPDDVSEALAACAKGKAPDAYLFTWPDGSRIKDFRGAWVKATAAAGVPELIFHDLRRSAVRRMRQKGLPTSTAMLITGHLTRMVFDNYDAANADDVAEAAKLL